ncbi:MAG: 16S rRNA (uracil(1498)-N(3))-methyltransferase [Eubacteriales bacterium]
MPRFFLSNDSFHDGKAFVTGQDARHISHVLRHKIADRITVCDMSRTRHECVIAAITEDEVTLDILESIPDTNEPDVFVTLFQALPKGDKMDTIISRAVELGVGEIIPFMSSRCVSRPDGGALEKKTSRWQRIADEAAKQCGRGARITVGGTVSFEEALDGLSRSPMGFMCYEGDVIMGIKSLIDGKKYSAAAFMIGPEGGFSPSEVEAVQKRSIPLAGLGPRILRTETASGCVLSCIMLLSGNLE